MKLYNYWRSGSSYRVRIALHLKNVSFEYVPVNLMKGEQHEDAHRQKGSFGYVPVLEVEESGRTHHIFQSVAMCLYLEEKFQTPALMPKEALARTEILEVMELVNSGIQPYHNLSVMKKVKELGASDTTFVKHFILQGVQQLEALVSKTSGIYTYGDSLTLADCFVIPQLYSARRFGVETRDFKTLTRIEEKCQALPAFQKAAPDAQQDAVKENK